MYEAKKCWIGFFYQIIYAKKFEPFQCSQMIVKYEAVTCNEQNYLKNIISTIHGNWRDKTSLKANVQVLRKTVYW